MFLGSGRDGGYCGNVAKLLMVALPAALVLGSGCVGDTGAPAAAQSPLVRPSVQALAASPVASRVLLTPTADPATSQRISWTSARAYKAQRVEYWQAPDAGDDAQPGQVQSSAALRMPRTTKKASGTTKPRYRAELTGLKPGTRYAYRIVNSRGAGAQAVFTTAGTAASDWSFIVLGDTQVDNRNTVRGIISAATAAVPDAALVVEVGDVVDRPFKDKQWADMFLAMGTSARTRNWLTAIGNHEQCVLIKCDSRSGQAFKSYFGRLDSDRPGSATWFTTDYQGVRFVVLDSFGGRIAEQAAFLDQALAQNPHQWSVVVMHAPLYATRPGRTNTEVRQAWGPIIDRHDVDVVLTGHDHAYARGQTQQDDRQDEVPVFVSSVSGPKFYPVSAQDWVANDAQLQVLAAQTATYSVVEVSPTRLSFRAVAAEPSAQAAPGSVLDQFQITLVDGAKVVAD